MNAHSERLSVATFYSPKMGTLLSPAKSLVAKHKVANFKQILLEEYYKGFFARKLDGKSYLETMKLKG